MSIHRKDIFAALDELDQLEAKKASIICEISHTCPYNGQSGKSTQRFSSFLDGLKTAEAIHYIAAALRKEGLSEGQMQAALLAICGVQVDAPLVRHLMLFR